MEKATEKQLKFILSLLEGNYVGNPEKRKSIAAKIQAGRPLSKRDASKAISIMKRQNDMMREAWRRVMAGGCGSNYLAAHGFLNDSDDAVLNSIWEKL